jgi:hypothetical protein
MFGDGALMFDSNSDPRSKIVVDADISDGSLTMNPNSKKALEEALNSCSLEVTSLDSNTVSNDNGA